MAKNNTEYQQEQWILEYYKSIIENQLGQVLLSPDIDAATRLSRLINNRYKIVTLDGDVVNVGGSMSGGSLNQTKSVIVIKQELKHTEEKQKLQKYTEMMEFFNITKGQMENLKR